MFPANLSRQQKLFHGSAFFVYGAAVHLAIFKFCVNRAYRKVAPPEWAASPVTYIVLALLAGAIVAFVMLRLLDRALASERLRSLGLLGRGGLSGIIATLIVFGASVVLGSVYASLRTSHGLAQVPMGLFFRMLEIGTYAGGFAVLSTPIALTYGALAGAYVLLISRRSAPPTLPNRAAPNAGSTPLLLGILSIVFAVIPFLGLGMGAFAVFYGLKARDGPELSRPASAVGGAVLGGLCIVFWVFSFGVFLAGRSGWFTGSH